MIPHHLYEALPTLYTTIGAFVLSLEHSSLMAFSGGILLMAGLMAFNMRLNARS